MKRPPDWRLLSPLVAVFAFGCGAGTSPEEPGLGRDEGAIINGAQPVTGSLEWQGVVYVSSSGGSCTGTLLSNRFVLTARHCVRDWASGWGNPQTNIQVVLEGPSGKNQVIASEAVLEFNGTALAGQDFALIQLVEPVTIGGGPSDQLFNPIYSGFDLDLVGQRVNCIGYGNNTLATTTIKGSGGGVLRTATLTVNAASSNTLTLPNLSGQIAGPGDSGSSCLFNGAIAGVASTCTGTGKDIDKDGQVEGDELSSITSCTYNSPNAFRTWANNLVHGNVTVTPFTMSPPPGVSVSGTVKSLDGLNAAVLLTSTTDIPSAALRGGWLEVSATNEPAGYLCGTTHTVVPASGDLVVTGACLGDGVVSTLLSSMM